MQKTLNKTACALTFALAAVLTLGGTASAQDTTPSNSQQSPSTTQSAPAKSSSTTTSKTQSTTKSGTATHHTPAKTAAPLVLTTDKQKASYAIGMNIGSSIRRQSVDVDPDILARGLKDSLAGGKTLLTDDEAKAALTALQAEARKAQEEKMQAASVANKKEGDAFLAENKTKSSPKATARSPPPTNLSSATTVALCSTAPNSIVPISTDNPSKFPSAASSKAGPKRCN
jgi:hypothetical protein